MRRHRLRTPQAASRPPPPALLLDGTAGTLPPGVSFARASGATRVTGSGQLQELGPNQPRWLQAASGAPLGLLLEESSTNYIPNPRLEGAVPGSPGTMPTTTGHYLPAATKGTLQRTVVGSGVDISGFRYLDLRYAGTASGTCKGEIYLHTTTVPAAPGQTWSGQARLALAAGSLAGVRFGLSIMGLNGSTWVEESFTAFTPTASPQRITVSRELQNASITAVRMVIRCNMTGTVDITLRLSAPQLEPRRHPTSLILPPPGSPAITTRAGEALILPAGLPGDSLSLALCFGGAWQGGLPSPPGRAFLFLSPAGGEGDCLAVLDPPAPRLVRRVGGVETLSLPRPEEAPADGTFTTCAVAADRHATFAAWDGGAPTRWVSGPQLGVLGVNGVNTGPAAGGAGMLLRQLRLWRRRLTPAQLQAAAARAG